MDSRWSGILLGYNTQAQFNIYNYGCLINCLAMVARYYNKAYDPAGINKAFKDMGAGKAFVAGGGDYVWGGFHLLFGDIEEKRIRTPDLLSDAQIGEIKSAIDAGYPVMVQLDVNPRTVENDQHFVLIVGYDPNDENNFTIADPLGGKLHSMKDYLGWFKPNARNTIEQYAIYKGPVPKIPASSIPVPADVFPVLVHKSTQWDQTTNEYLPGQDPAKTTFDNLKAVITGIKSRITDLTNQVASAQADSKSKDERISNLEGQVLQEQNLKKDLTDKLNDALKSSAQVVGVYEGKLKEKQGSIDTLIKEKGDLNTQLAQAQAQLKASQDELKKAKEGSVAQLSVADLLSLILKKLLTRAS